MFYVNEEIIPPLWISFIIFGIDEIPEKGSA